MSKTEIGKLYSVLGITGSLIPILANPAFRQLYNLTISTFPRSVLVLSAAVGLVCLVCNIFIYTQKEAMQANCGEGEKDGESIEDEGFDEENK